MPHLCYISSMKNLHIPRLGRISGWRRRRWIERAPLRAAFAAKMKEWNNSPLNFAVIENKKKVRSAWNSDRITLRRAAGVLARRLPWIWKSAAEVLSAYPKAIRHHFSIIAMAKSWENYPLTKGGVVAQ